MEATASVVLVIVLVPLELFYRIVEFPHRGDHYKGENGLCPFKHEASGLNFMALLTVSKESAFTLSREFRANIKIITPVSREFLLVRMLTPCY